MGTYPELKDLPTNVLSAAERIRGHVRCTPFEYSRSLSELTEAKVWLKLENQQYTGSFKVRGAMNKLLSLNSIERELGVVAASTGDHGAAVVVGNGSPSEMDHLATVNVRGSSSEVQPRLVGRSPAGGG